MSLYSAEADVRSRPEGAFRISPKRRQIRIGLLGLGNVGQAVARLAASSAGAAAGIQFRIDAALVRDVNRFRRCNHPSRVTTNASAFLRGTYDVVVEALGGLEPARTIVARLLGRRVPVVTANKTLIAEAGEELRALATARGTTLRYEASAIAGVPFLGTLAARPLVSNIDRFAAVLNGTSNFILSTLEANGGTFANALALAEQQGLTEPDPSRDLDGDDAADKLALLASLFGWGRVTRTALEVGSVRHVSSTDLRVARSLGGALKPLAIASHAPGGVEACIGPTWVPGGTPLAALGGTLNGIELHGLHVRDLFFSGPGAGPDVTAATLLDDVFESVRGESNRSPRESSSADSGGSNPSIHMSGALPRHRSSTIRARSEGPSGRTRADGASIQVNSGLEDPPLPVGSTSPHTRVEDLPPSVHSTSPQSTAEDPRLYSRSQRVLSVVAPITPWFIRVAFPGMVPTVDAVTEIVGHAGLTIEHVTDAIDGARYVLTGRGDRALVNATLDHAWRRHRVQCVAYRRLA